MDVTVVISNYNYAQFVGSAIESCLFQSTPCKIIVVDDASTDDSWKIIKQYNVRAVRLKQNSEGNARGKNIGIALSNTEFVTCLDADDMLLYYSLEHRLGAIGHFDFVHGWSIPVKTLDSYRKLMQDPQIKNKPFARSSKAKKVDINSPRWSFAIEASTVLARRSLYERFGLYDEEMKWAIDREMWWRWLNHGAQMKVLDEYVSIYRQHDKQLTKDRSRKDPEKCSKMLKDRQILRKNINPQNTLMLDTYNPKEWTCE